MKIEKLAELLNERAVPVTIKVGQGEIRIEPDIELFVSEDLSETNLKVCGFTMQTAGKEVNVKTIDELLKKIEAAGAVQDGAAELVNIDGTYSSIEEYEEKLAFDNIDMAGLLEKYASVADCFSLSCPYNNGYDVKHMFGIYGISEELASAALEELEKNQLRLAKSQYDRIPEKERMKLPPFGKLYEEIKGEYEEYYKKHKKRASECGGSVFFCDAFADGRTKYKKPAELWHLYNSVDFVGSCGFSLEQMKKNTRLRSLDCELDGEEYRELKDSLIKTDVTFCWHCTVSGQLHKVFYFELNDKTVGWLSRRKNDYDFSGLEDLAFYKDGEVVFSSCTHEGFHTGIKK